jgi:hypothetical protein
VSMSLPEIAALLAFLLGGWVLWDTLKARETANAAMRAACAERGFLFLDDTVSLRSVRPARDDEGHVRLQRAYRFQYSDTGHNRRDGSITLLGDAVVALNLVAGAPPRDALR